MLADVYGFDDPGVLSNVSGMGFDLDGGLF